MDELLDVLGLEGCSEVRVGNPLERGISGGEARRLSMGIGVADLESVRLLLLDEPTTVRGMETALQVVMVGWWRWFLLMTSGLIAGLCSRNCFSRTACCCQYCRCCDCCCGDVGLVLGVILPLLLLRRVITTLDATHAFGHDATDGRQRPQVGAYLCS